MDLHFTNLHIVLPAWLLIVLMAMLLIQTILSLINSYYGLKLAKLKSRKATTNG